MLTKCKFLLTELFCGLVDALIICKSVRMAPIICATFWPCTNYTIKSVQMLKHMTQTWKRTNKTADEGEGFHWAPGCYVLPLHTICPDTMNSRMLAVLKF
jgi:hypothetical protein